MLRFTLGRRESCVYTILITLDMFTVLCVCVCVCVCVEFKIKFGSSNMRI